MPTDRQSTDGEKALAVLLLVGSLLLLAASVATGAWNAGRAPLPFVWRDVAIVHLLCALPLSIALVGYLDRRLPAIAVAIVASVLLAASAATMLYVAEPNATTALKSSAALGMFLRSISAIGPAIAVVTIGTLLCGRRAKVERGHELRRVAAIALGIAALGIAPATYIAARTRHDAGKLGECIQESRIGEARQLVEGLLVLDAGGQFNGRPLTAVAEEIGKIEAELERRVSGSLSPQAIVSAHLERAVELAMLGRGDSALAALSQVRDPQVAPDVDNLRGSIHANRGDWLAGMASYERARRAWTMRPRSPARNAGLLRATTGVAFCQRKAGQYAEAEATYRQVLTLSPTADSHFLLAQFYEDAQQADLARMHARRAMALAPERYRQPGEQLIAKLTVFHFGCLGVYRSEHDSKAASPQR